MNTSKVFDALEISHAYNLHQVSFVSALIILLIDMTYAFFQGPTATDIVLLYSR